MAAVHSGFFMASAGARSPQHNRRFPDDFFLDISLTEASEMEQVEFKSSERGRIITNTLEGELFRQYKMNFVPNQGSLCFFTPEAELEMERRRANHLSSLGVALAVNAITTGRPVSPPDAAGSGRVHFRLVAVVCFGGASGSRTCDVAAAVHARSVETATTATIATSPATVSAR